MTSEEDDSQAAPTFTGRSFDLGSQVEVAILSTLFPRRSFALWTQLHSFL